MTHYRGGVGQVSWALHRITGVGVLIFLCLHILDTFLIILGPAHYNQIIGLYRLPIFRVGEVGLVACVLFHALNGIRIILLDFHPKLMRFQRQMFLVELICFVASMIPVTYLMLEPVFRRGH